MVEAISVLKFGEIFGQLERRFRKLTADQQKIYYERLKFNDEDTLSKAITHLVDHAPHFPTPGEIRKECREVDAKQYKDGNKIHSIRSSCSKCREGYVKFAYQQHRRDGSFITKYESRPCAVCNQEPNGVPHYIQIQDQIFFSAKRQGEYMWVPDASRELMPEYTPCYSSADLEAYFEEERRGIFRKTEPPAELFKGKRLPSISPKEFDQIPF